jgi:hypothetical protein
VLSTTTAGARGRRSRSLEPGERLDEARLVDAEARDDDEVSARSRVAPITEWTMPVPVSVSTTE